jgi:hypothetical protein
MPLDKHDPEIAGLEAALAALAPMPGRINRDALLFRAGQASVPGRGWGWPCATATLGLVAAVLGVVVLVRPAPAPVERIVVMTVPVPVPVPVPPAPGDLAVPPGADVEAAQHEETAPGQSPMNYLQLQMQVVRWGLEGVPAMAEMPPPTEPPVTRDSLLSLQREPAPITKLLHLGSFFQ